MSYYQALARRLLTAAYEIKDGRVATVQELVELFADEATQERVLPDRDSERLRRLELLTAALRDAILDCDKRRIASPLRESGVAVGSFLYVFAEDAIPDDAEREIYTRYRLVPTMISALRELTPTEFEILSARALQVIGCTEITVTQSQRDDGVDAIASLPLAPTELRKVLGSPFYRVAGHISFLVYAQAKRYSEGNPVGQEVVFQLDGSWNAMKASYFEGTLRSDLAAALSRADLRMSDPVLLLIITTSRFTGGALTKAETMGVITLDVEQLAQLLLHDAFGVKDGGDSSFSVDILSLRAALVDVVKS